jgi:hypothetical protein
MRRLMKHALACAPLLHVSPPAAATVYAPFARTIDAAKKYVVSSTLDRVVPPLTSSARHQNRHVLPLRGGRS